jgi:hypothetical protein
VRNLSLAEEELKLAANLAWTSYLKSLSSAGIFTQLCKAVESLATFDVLVAFADLALARELTR